MAKKKTTKKKINKKKTNKTAAKPRREIIDPVWDAETLMRAEEIKQNNSRYNAAVRAAGGVARERKNAARAAEKIAKRKTQKK